MVVGLAGADHRPLDVSHRRPPAQPLGLGSGSPGGLVSAEERLELAQAGDGQLVVAEAPRADRQPADVLGRVAGVTELPVDHGGQAVLVDDEVAEPEVAVHERGPLRRRRPVESQPAQPGLHSRQRLTDLVQRPPPELAGLERRVGAAGQAVDAVRVDRVDLGEGRGELARESLARDRKLVSPQHARRDRGPLHEVHEIAGAAAEAAAGRFGGHRAGDRDSRQIGGRNRSQLELQRRERHPLGGLAPQHEARLSPRRDHERLPRGAALDRAQLELARVLADLGEQRAHRRGVGRLRRHRPAARARGARSGALGSPPGPCTSTRCTGRGRSPPADRRDTPGSRSTGSGAPRS